MAARSTELLCVMCVACFFLVGSMLLLAVAFGTDNWQAIYVNRDALKTQSATLGSDFNTSLYYDYRYFSRERGIFRTCVDNDEALFFSTNPDKLDIVDWFCFYDEGLFLPTVEARATWGADNAMRDHLVRLHIGLFSCSLFMMLVTVLLVACSCANVSSRLMLWAGLAGMMGALFAIGGMASFHGYIYMETDKVLQPPFELFWEKLVPLGQETSWTFGYSYILGWVASAFAVLATILFMSAAIVRHDDRRDEKSPMIPRGPRRRRRGPRMRPPVIMQPPMLKPAYPTLPLPDRPHVLPMLTYPPEMRRTQSMRSHRMGENAVFQSQPPAYPGNTNFSSRSIAYF